MTRVPGVEYLPGADVAQNASRWQGVPFVVLHEPQGACEGVRGLGRTRHHSTPGTFTGTGCEDGRRAQHYDDEVRCSHAAGGNAGPGWEDSDYTPNPLRASYSDECLLSMGRTILHYHHVHGVPLRYFANEAGTLAGRVWADRAGVRAFFAHRAIDYPPNRSYLHYDGPLTREFDRSIELAGGSAPAPAPGPIPSTQEDDMDLVIGIVQTPDFAKGALVFCPEGDLSRRIWLPSERHYNDLLKAGPIRRMDVNKAQYDRMVRLQDPRDGLPT